MYYNEIKAFEAEPFIGLLSAIIEETFEDGHLYAESYSLNHLEISFPSKKKADVFMKMICSPFVLFEDIGDCFKEHYCV